MLQQNVPFLTAQPGYYFATLVLIGRGHIEGGHGISHALLVGVGGILSHYRVHSDLRQMQVSSYKGWRFVPDRDCERRPAESRLFHPGWYVCTIK
jgi:hypothetical protein